jgi:D-galactarolactone cycloisomerase
MTGPIHIARINAYSFRSPITEPIKTSFGTMHDRPAVFVRVEDTDGAFGWGEVFANWPSAAAEHRVNLLARDIGPLAFEYPLNHPSELFYALTERTHIVALQSGEWGPFRQVIAGLDIAVWDLFARKSGKTLRRFMNNTAADDVPAYASGIHINEANTLIEKARQIGFTNFKVKVGFNLEVDLTQLHRLFEEKSNDETIAADANQAWDVEDALKFTSQTATVPLAWLEEPIPADSSAYDWRKLNKACSYPLAGGENIVDFRGFEAAMKSALLQVVQPDIIKWGGLTGSLAVGKKALTYGLLYCPHFLGGGIGLQASANLLSAVGGAGLLEVDVNPNPLRDGFGATSSCIGRQGWTCNKDPGLGITLLPEELNTLRTHDAEVS